MPKEMLPVIDKPIIQYVVEEAVAAGITDIIIVTGAHKRSIEDHFDHQYQLEEKLDADGKNAKSEIFASGWLEGDTNYLGRPNDIILAKDGSILVADDWAGAIYRISYKK